VEIVPNIDDDDLTLDENTAKEEDTSS